MFEMAKTAQNAVDSKKDECISDKSNYVQAVSGNFSHNKQSEMFQTHKAQVRFHGKRVYVRTERPQ
jgi:hypothetical protein